MEGLFAVDLRGVGDVGDVGVFGVVGDRVKSGVGVEPLDVILGIETPF